MGLEGGESCPNASGPALDGARLRCCTSIRERLKRSYSSIQSTQAMCSWSAAGVLTPDVADGMDGTPPVSFPIPAPLPVPAPAPSLATCRALVKDADDRSCGTDLGCSIGPFSPEFFSLVPTPEELTEDRLPTDRLPVWCGWCTFHCRIFDARDLRITCAKLSA